MNLRRLGLLVLALMAGACATAPTPSPTAMPSPTQAPTAAPTPTPKPTANVSCLVQPAEPPLNDDPCPAGIAAVRLLTAPLGTPIRIVLLPGPFQCGDVFPGPTPVACFGPLLISGTSMHGWVAFLGRWEVAAIELRRAVSFVGGTPVGTPGPWEATLVRFEVPPATFVMP